MPERWQRSSASAVLSPGSRRRDRPAASGERLQIWIGGQLGVARSQAAKVALFQTAINMPNSMYGIEVSGTFRVSMPHQPLQHSGPPGRLLRVHGSRGGPCG
jgi:hypothetical protein